jgi:hypothetical protein
MAKFDLTYRMGQYLDRHLIFPLLEFLSAKHVSSFETTAAANVNCKHEMVLYPNLTLPLCNCVCVMVFVYCIFFLGVGPYDGSMAVFELWSSES